jgi:hypothetical protein
MDRRTVLAIAVLAVLLFGPIAAVASARLPAAPSGQLGDAASDRIAVLFTGH